MIAHVDPKSPGKGFLVSIPRDLWVHDPRPRHAAHQRGLQLRPDDAHPDDRAGLPRHDQPLPRGRLRHLRPDRQRDRRGAHLLPDPRVRPVHRARHHDTRLRRAQRTRRRSSTCARATTSTRHRRTAGRTREAGTRSPTPTSAASAASSTSSAASRRRRSARARATRSRRRRCSRRRCRTSSRDKGMGLSDFLALVRAFRSVDPSAVQMETRADDAGTLVIGEQRRAATSTRRRPRRCFEQLRTFITTTKPAKIPKIPPSDITVQVLNGSGVKGIAGVHEDRARRVRLRRRRRGRATPTAPTTRRPRCATCPARSARPRSSQSYLGGVGQLVALHGVGQQSRSGRRRHRPRLPGRREAGHRTRPCRPRRAARCPPNPGSTPGVTPADHGGRKAPGRLRLSGPADTPSGSGLEVWQGLVDSPGRGVSPGFGLRSGRAGADESGEIRIDHRVERGRGAGPRHEGRRHRRGLCRPDDRRVPGVAGPRRRVRRHRRGAGRPGSSAGDIPIREEGLPQLVGAGLAARRLSFVVGAAKAVAGRRARVPVRADAAGRRRRGRPLLRRGRGSRDRARRSRRAPSSSTSRRCRSARHAGCSRSSASRAPRSTASPLRRTPSSCARARRSATSSIPTAS